VAESEFELFEEVDEVWLAAESAEMGCLLGGGLFEVSESFLNWL